MDKAKLQKELKKVRQAIAAQKALRGTLPDEQIDATLVALRKKLNELAAQLAQATVSGSGAAAQGSGAKAAGERGVIAEGDVGGSIITGDQSSAGGIRANRIEADNVVDGVQQLSGDLSNAADAVALAEALRRGGITADSIAAKNVVSGLQYIADPAQATPDELRQEIGALKRKLAAAIAAGEVETNADLEDAQEALDKAESELAKEDPGGSRVVRKLKETADILTASAKTADAARQTGLALAKLAPMAAALYHIAATLFS